MSAEHGLTHRTMRDSSGERLTPACICGWHSPDGSHWRFDRHMRTATQPSTEAVGVRPARADREVTP